MRFTREAHTQHTHGVHRRLPARAVRRALHVLQQHRPHSVHDGHRNVGVPAGGDLAAVRRRMDACEKRSVVCRGRALRVGERSRKQRLHERHRVIVVAGRQHVQPRRGGPTVAMRVASPPHLKQAPRTGKDIGVVIDDEGHLRGGCDGGGGLAEVQRRREVHGEDVKPHVGVSAHAGVVLEVLLQGGHEGVEGHRVVVDDVDCVGLSCGGGQQHGARDEGLA